VQKWEIGQKRPTGTALKLLHLVQKNGLDIVAQP
jgi:putative transcriptional regulator